MKPNREEGLFEMALEERLCGESGQPALESLGTNETTLCPDCAWR
jgi:hypothetical protein